MMRQVLLALTIIIAVASLAAVGSYANFSDTEEEMGDSLQAGSLDLILIDDDESGDGVTKTWYWEWAPYPGGMKPGDTLTNSVSLQNLGSVTASYVDIYCVIVNVEPDWDTDEENDRENELLLYPVPPVPFEPNHGIYDKDKEMIITQMAYNGLSLIWGEVNSFDTTRFTDDDGDGQISLHEFKASGLQNLPPPTNTGQQTLTMTIKFDEDAGDEYQGDQTQMTLIFALMQ